jgi:hypothetical protein
MKTLRYIQQRLVEALSELYEGLSTAQEWLEEGNATGPARSNFDSLNESTRASFEA